MKNKIGAVMTVLGLGICGAVLAHQDIQDMPKPSYSKEFEQVKSLAGTWKGTCNEPMGKDKNVSVEYRVTSAGSAVEEKLGMGSPHEMVDMYIEENGVLTMTHYCAMGNHPHMVLKKSQPKLLVLEMGPTAGIDPIKDLHMHTLVLELKDSNHLTQRWTSYENGKPGEETVIQLTRVQ